MKTFEQWLDEKKNQFLSENPTPKSGDYAYLELFESAVHSWERALELRVSIWNGQKEAWSACAAELEQRLKEAEDVIAFYADKRNYMRPGIGEINPFYDGDTDCSNRGGKRAREYQKKWEIK